MIRFSWCLYHHFRRQICLMPSGGDAGPCAAARPLSDVALMTFTCPICLGVPRMQKLSFLLSRVLIAVVVANGSEIFSQSHHGNRFCWRAKLSEGLVGF